MEWYAVHTRSRHEKITSRLLENKEIEVFLPLREVLRQWSDRKKKILLPVFPGYLFVNADGSKFSEIKKTKGIVSIVGFGTHPHPIPEKEIESLKVLVNSKLKIDPHPYLRTGKQVQVKRGPLAGAVGVIEEKKGKHRLVVSVHLIQRSLSVEIDADDVELV